MDLPSAPVTGSGAELAIRLLTILGMVLLFAGIAGFVVFAFGDVGKAWRPLAELLIPFALFASAPAFRRLGAPFVARAVVAMGGVALPIMAAASLVDNAAPPTDPTGRAVGSTLFIVGCVITGAYTIVAIRRPTSLLRLLVFPMLWLTVAAAALILETSPPGGRQAFSPLPGQWAAVSCAIAATGLALLLPSDHLLMRVGRSAIVPGALSAYVLVWFAAAGHDWVSTPLLVAGVASIIALETAAPRIGSSAVSALQATIIVLTSAACFSDLGAGPSAGAAILVLIGGIEWQAARRPNPTAATLFATAAALMLPATLARSSIALAVAAGLFVWSWTRRLRPAPSIPIGVANITVWLSTALMTIALSQLWSPRDAVLFMAAASAVVAGGLRLVAVPRFSQDLLVGSWVLVVALATLELTALQLTGGGHVHHPELGLATSAMASLALAAAPRWPKLRVWTTTGGTFIALCWLGVWADVGRATTFGAIAWLGTVPIIWSVLRRGAASGHLGLAGLAATGTATFGALAASGSRSGSWPWATTGALLATSIGCFILESRGRAGESPAQDLLQSWAEPTLADRTATESEPPPSIVAMFLQFMVVATASATVISTVASTGLSNAPVLWGFALSSAVPLASVGFGRSCDRRRARSGRGYVQFGWGAGVTIALATAQASASAFWRRQSVFTLNFLSCVSVEGHRRRPF